MLAFYLIFAVFLFIVGVILLLDKIIDFLLKVRFHYHATFYKIISVSGLQQIIIQPALTRDVRKIMEFYFSKNSGVISYLPNEHLWFFSLWKFFWEPIKRKPLLISSLRN